MKILRRIFILLITFQFRWLITFAQEPNYFFTAPHGFQHRHDGFINSQEVSPFRKNSPGFEHLDAYLSHPDLDTSDLPPHLQRTLPQYQLGLLDNSRDPFGQDIGLNYNPPTIQNVPPFNNQPSQYTQQIIPSTHRPSYSHLFSKASHNHDPSQTETFLGQITIQSPADLPAPFQNRDASGFQPSVNFPITHSHNFANQLTKPENKNNLSKPSDEVSNQKFLKPPQTVNQHLDFTEKPSAPSGNKIQLSGISRANFLNHRTRIFAPETGKNSNKSRPHVNAYFVNNNGDVFITTRKSNFSPKPTAAPIRATTLKRRNHFIPAHPRISSTTEFNSASSSSTAEAARTDRTNFNLDSLLEEPLDTVKQSSNKDNNVEVIQSVTVPPNHFYTLNPSVNTSEETLTDYTTTDEDDFTTDEYEDDTTEPDYDAENSTYTYYEDTTEGTEINTVDGKNLIKSEKNLDTIENKTVSSTNTSTSNYSSYDILTIKPTTIDRDNNFHEFVDTTVIDTTTEVLSTTPEVQAETEIAMSVSSSMQQNNDRSQNHTKNSTSLGDTVISVVTTKSVINNTVIGTMTPNPKVTDQMTPSTPSTINQSSEKNHDDVIDQPKYDSTGEENSTEGWVVVASVQTSRSVSGARYLPFSVVEQHERTKLLNEPAYLNETAENSTTTSSKPQAQINSTTPSSIDKQNSSTESLIDKLDRVQSDLSSGLLTGGFNNGANNIAVITEGALDKVDETTLNSDNSADITTTSTTTTTTPKPSPPSPPSPPPVVIRKFSPHARPSTERPKTSKARFLTRKMNTPHDAEKPQSDQPSKLLIPDVKHKNSTTGRSSGISNKNKVIVQDIDQGKDEEYPKKSLDSLLFGIKFQDNSAFLPAGYKPSSEEVKNTTRNSTTLPKVLNSPEVTTKKQPPLTKIFEKAKNDDISAFLPPGYKITTEGTPNNISASVSDILKKAKQEDISAFLPPGYKATEETPTTKAKSDIFSKIKQDDISAFLPPGYKQRSSNNSPAGPGNTTENTKKSKQDDTKPKSDTLSEILKKAKQDDISAFLPPGFKASKTTPTPKPKDFSDIFAKTKQDDVSALLPPGYKASSGKPAQNESSTTGKSKSIDDLLKNAKQDDISALLPPGFKGRFNPSKSTTSTSTTTTEKPLIQSTTASSGSIKVVFPSRPGGIGTRKNNRLTTPKSYDQGVVSGGGSGSSVSFNTPPAIQKGWPTRVTTEFTGWPTPSTTPISIEKLLEQARAAAGSSSTTTSTTSTTSTTTTTTTTTTTAKPTTPGLCVSECDLAGTIKLVGGAKWVPELLDRNTKEWQILANEVQYQLDDVFSKSNALNKWYKKIRIDGFSEGSVLVDYLVELNNISRQVDTKELKILFHDALEDAIVKGSLSREAKASDLTTETTEGKLTLGNFVVDPKYTDFIVLPKQMHPTVGYAEDNILLPQWAIAIIVIGLASLLFVIIFGVTVLVNKQKNAKKKQPSTLTEDMLNELNKNHMGGIDNYGADDLYNMEDVWNEKAYETKLPKKRSAGSLHDNSMPNIYDSWRSEWNGYYYNTYYGNHPGSSHSGYGRRRSDYDTNF